VSRQVSRIKAGTIKVWVVKRSGCGDEVEEEEEQELLGG